MKNIFMKKIGENKKSKGQSLVEYGLILALVSVVAITVLQTMGTQIKTTVTGLSNNLSGANSMSACESTGGTWTGAATGGAGTCTCPAGTILNVTAGADFGKCQ